LFLILESTDAKPLSFTFHQPRIPEGSQRSGLKKEKIWQVQDVNGLLDSFTIYRRHKPENQEKKKGYRYARTANTVHKIPSPLASTGNIVRGSLFKIRLGESREADNGECNEHEPSENKMQITYHLIERGDIRSFSCGEKRYKYCKIPVSLYNHLSFG